MKYPKDHWTCIAFGHKLVQVKRDGLATFACKKCGKSFYIKVGG